MGLLISAVKRFFAGSWMGDAAGALEGPAVSSRSLLMGLGLVV